MNKPKAAGIEIEIRKSSTTRGDHGEVHIDFSKIRGKVFCVLDTETSGMNPNNDGIISLTVSKGRFRRGKYKGSVMEGEFNPGCKIHPRASLVNGYTDDNVKEFPTLDKEHLQDFLNFIGGFPIVCHNVNFDRKFLDAALHRNGMKPLKNDWYCTMNAFKAAYPEENASLDNICDYFDMNGRTSNIHSGSEDVRLTMQVMWKLITTDDPGPVRGAIKGIFRALLWLLMIAVGGFSLLILLIVLAM